MVIQDPLKCPRKIINFSSIGQTDRFDKKSFNPENLLENLSETSPKMIAMLEQINKLDEKDYARDEKLYKHYIYSGVGDGYGSKIIASGMIASGYTLAIKPQGSKIMIDEAVVNSNNESKLLVLSSTALWNNPTTQKTTKEILSVYNKRPENINGNLARFIILDHGFKEGVDLFDVKYVHIFEDQLLNSDYTQAQGRALRFCGQKGLPFSKSNPFSKSKGWQVDVYNYSLYKPVPRNILKLSFFNGKEGISEYLQKKEQELVVKEKVHEKLLSLLEIHSIDSDLNKNINNYSSKNRKKTIILMSVLTGILTLSSLLAYKRFKKK